MPQPYKASDGRIDPIARLQGCSDVERIANGRYDHGFGAERAYRLDPERHQTAYPGILQHEQPAVAKLFTKHRLGAFAKLAGDGRAVPIRIESSPIVPSGPRGRQDFIVHIRNRLGFQESGLIVARNGPHQGSRQVASHEVQQASDERSAAAVHAGNQDRNPFVLTRHSRLPGSCAPESYSLFNKAEANIPIFPICVCRYTPDFQSPCTLDSPSARRASR